MRCARMHRSGDLNPLQTYFDAAFLHSNVIHKF